MRLPGFTFLLAVGITLVSLLGSAERGSASPALNLSGTVAFVQSSGRFVYQTGAPYGYVPVLYSQSMISPSGSQIVKGQRVTVLGSLQNHVLIATQITIGSTAVGRYHIATLAYDNYWAQGSGASAVAVNQLITYALGNGKSVADCHSVSNGCKAVFYLNPNHIWDNGTPACAYHPDAEEMIASSENWFVHNTGYTDSAHRVYGIDKNGCHIWELNPNSVGLQTWWGNYLRANADQYDMYFLDANQMSVVNEGYFPYGSGGGCIPWPSYCRSTQEIPTDAAEVSAHAKFVNAMRHRNGAPMEFLFQQATLRNVALDVSAFLTTKSFVGVSCEGCVATYAQPVRPQLYASVLQEMASVNATSGSFLLISHGNSPAGSPTQILQRLATTGIMWLGYSEGHTVVQPDLASNTNNLQVWPEDLIYPATPLQSMFSGPTDLQVAPNVYRREFASCYQRGIAIGPCATVVNGSVSPLAIRSAWLRQTYRHTVVLSGGDVLAGGVANIVGSPFIANSTWVQAGGALILTP